jgi:hypothetical protein
MCNHILAKILHMKFSSDSLTLIVSNYEEGYRIVITGTAPNPFPARAFPHTFLFDRLLESKNFVNMIYNRGAKRKERESEQC